MKKELTRRDLIGRAGLAIGGAMSLGVLNGCSGSSGTDGAPVPECAANAAALKDFPYAKYLPAGFALDAATAQEAAYHGYYTGGGCGNGVWVGLLGELARAGEPFSQLPMAFGAFGGGGIAGFGSICGAVLSGNLILNTVVSNATARANLMTELMRWYETFDFPTYAPVTVDPAEAAATEGGTSASKLVLDWGTEPTKPAVTKVQPGSHLCHASVSGWCAKQSPIVAAGGANQTDKKARCARVTADVAGKVVALLNAYLASGALGSRSFAAPAVPTTVTECTTCHGTGVLQHNGTAVSPAATGMSCPTCHGDKLPLSGTGHSALPACTGCH